MLNPELEMADNLCKKSVALSVLIWLCSILELQNVLFLRIYTMGFLVATVNLSHLLCPKGMSQKRPHSRVQPPHSGNWCSSHWRVFWGLVLSPWFLPLVSIGLSVAAVSDTNCDASLNCCSYTAELRHCFTGCWQSLAGHPGPPEWSQGQGESYHTTCPHCPF